jgi:hypothetical protein
MEVQMNRLLCLGAVTVVFAGGAAALMADGAPKAVTTPAVTSVLAAGEPWLAGAVDWDGARIDLAKFGYSEKEFFFSGTTALGPYTSRMIVRRPIDAKRFNGTVIVEWLNASAGFDMDVDFPSLVPLIAKDGYAYVGVSAQQVTIEFLAKRDVVRYGRLKMTDAMPAQPAAFEVFSQAGMALRKNGNGDDPLSGLRAARLIAIGQSQSSSRLMTFINTVHGMTLEPVYDAFLPHSGGSAPTRFPAPILKLNSENEAPGYFAWRNVSNSNYRYWEVAGSSHQPLEGAENVLRLLTIARGGGPKCPYPLRGPGGPARVDPVLRSAVSHLDVWLRTGQAPPTGPVMEMVASEKDPKVGVIQRDKYGNALGGIRLPQQEVPTGRNGPAYACSSQTFPQFDPFDGNADAGKDPTDTYIEPANLKALYKNNDDYFKKFTAAAKVAEQQGFLLKADVERLLGEAKTVKIDR